MCKEFKTNVMPDHVVKYQPWKGTFANKLGNQGYWNLSSTWVWSLVLMTLISLFPKKEKKKPCAVAFRSAITFYSNVSHLKNPLKYLQGDGEMKEGERRRETGGGEEEESPGQSHSWNKDPDTFGKDKHTLSKVKALETAPLKYETPGNPERSRVTSTPPLLSWPAITARSNYLFSLGVNVLWGFLCQRQQILWGHSSPVGWKKSSVCCSHRAKNRIDFAQAKWKQKHSHKRVHFQGEIIHL